MREPGLLVKRFMAPRPWLKQGCSLKPGLLGRIIQQSGPFVDSPYP
jgi:hypothetical protein